MEIKVEAINFTLNKEQIEELVKRWHKLNFSLEQVMQKKAKMDELHIRETLELYGWDADRIINSNNFLRRLTARLFGAAFVIIKDHDTKDMVGLTCRRPNWWEKILYGRRK